MPAAAIDEELRPWLRQFCRHIAEPDVLANGRRRTAARANADRSLLRVEQRVTVTCDAASDHLEADEFPGEAPETHAFEGGFTDEVRLVKADDPTQARLERVGRFVDVVSIEREPSLEPERVACPQSGRLDVKGCARLDERAPKARSVVPRTKNFDAVLARIPGACRSAADARESRIAELKTLKRL